MLEIVLANARGMFGKGFHEGSYWLMRSDNRASTDKKLPKKSSKIIEFNKNIRYISIMVKNIDSNDIKILEILQIDATRSLESIAEEIGVSLNTCWRRVQRLEAEGILERRVALIDNEKVGLPLTVFVSIRTDDHSKSWSERFDKAVKSMPEIVEFYRLAGDVDYILKMMVRSVADYDRAYQHLISKVKLSDVSASFAMEKMKFTTELPLRS